MSVSGSTVTLGQVDELHAELLGEGGEDVLFLGEAAFDEELVQRLGRGGGVGLGDARQVGRRNGAASNQSLHQLHFRPNRPGGRGVGRGERALPGCESGTE